VDNFVASFATQLSRKGGGGSRGLGWINFAISGLGGVGRHLRLRRGKGTLRQHRGVGRLSHAVFFSVYRSVSDRFGIRQIRYQKDSALKSFGIRNIRNHRDKKLRRFSGVRQLQKNDTAN
jgi:hypothetical protein